MAWQTTTFEREALYNEVWTEPITKVAGRYGLSDVGLRKICIGLEIPMPSRGHWAKLAAGQKVKQAPLNKSSGDQSYTRSVYVEERNLILEQRVAVTRQAMPALPGPTTLSYRPPDDLSTIGKEAAQIEKLSRKLKEENGAIILTDRAWADIDVSRATRIRAIQLLDQFAVGWKAMNGTFDLTLDSATVDVSLSQKHEILEIRRGHVRLYGKDFVVRVKERFKSEEIVEPPDTKTTKAGRTGTTGPDWSAINPVKKYRYTPTGRLQLGVCRVGTYYVIQRIEDTPLTRVEDKLFALIERLEALALEQKLKEDLAKEAALERERQSEIWKQRKAVKDAMVKKLEWFESLARDLDRAESLRRLAKKISGSPGARSDLVDNLALLERMANWLDPLVAQHWPEIDDTPDKNPFSCW